MKSKGKLFWARFLMLMALFVTTLFACVSLGTISARAEETGEGAALSEGGGVSVRASSSPLIISMSTPLFSEIYRTTSAPFDESRMADVAHAR